MKSAMHEDMIRTNHHCLSKLPPANKAEISMVNYTEAKIQHHLPEFPIVGLINLFFILMHLASKTPDFGK